MDFEKTTEIKQPPPTTMGSEDTKTSQGKFQCGECPKTFSRKDHLNYHVKIKHLAEQPYSCHLCDKSFAAKGDLTRHTVKHGERTFFCDLCDASFHFQGELNNHKKSAHEKKCLKCTDCEETFASKESMKSHRVKQHNLVTPYICDYCCLSHASQRL